MMRAELKSSAERGSRRREKADSLRLRRLRLLTSAATVRFGDRRGFTLIELLVVIAIIAALAALIAGLGRVAYRARVENRARAELNMLVGAIEAYHKKFGFYPPDNTNNPALPPLYYELVGWTGPQSELQGVANAFGVGGFVNSDPERKNFLPNLKPKGYTAILGRSPQAFVLTFPAVGPGPGGDFNAWNYRSTRPVNNTESFDLWLNVLLSSKTNTIANWKE